MVVVYLAKNVNESNSEVEVGVFCCTSVGICVPVCNCIGKGPFHNLNQLDQLQWLCIEWINYNTDNMEKGNTLSNELKTVKEEGTGGKGLFEEEVTLKGGDARQHLSIVLVPRHGALCLQPNQVPALGRRLTCK